MTTPLLRLGFAVAIASSFAIAVPRRAEAAERSRAKYWTVYFNCGGGREVGDMVKAASRGEAIEAFCTKECSGKWQGASRDRCKQECSLALRKEDRGGEFFGSRSCRYQIK